MGLGRKRGTGTTRLPTATAARCCSCERVLPAAAFRLRRWKQYTYLRSECRECERPRKDAAAARSNKKKPERLRAARRRYARNHPDRVADQNRRTRAKRAKALSTLTAEQWETILVAFGRACVYCGRTDMKL